jgi:ubiquitin
MPLIQENKSFRQPDPYAMPPFQQPPPPPFQSYPNPPQMNYQYQNNPYAGGGGGAGGGHVSWDDLGDAINLGLQYSINDLNQTATGKQYRLESDIYENNTIGSHKRGEKSLSSLSDGGTKIFAKTLTGKILTLYVELTESVDDVKNRIHDLEGVPPNQQRLVFDGSLLQDGHNLSEYSVQEKSTLHLVYTSA